MEAGMFSERSESPKDPHEPKSSTGTFINNRLLQLSEVDFMQRCEEVVAKAILRDARHNYKQMITNCKLSVQAESILDRIHAEKIGLAITKIAPVSLIAGVVLSIAVNGAAGVFNGFVCGLIVSGIWTVKAATFDGPYLIPYSLNRIKINRLVYACRKKFLNDQEYWRLSHEWQKQINHFQDKARKHTNRFMMWDEAPTQK